MAEAPKIEVQIKVEPVRKTIDGAKYQEKWEDKCNEEGRDSSDPAYPPMTKEFVVECVNDDLESGELDLSEAFESASAEATLVE